MKHIHMLGICGTGMGNLATLLTEAGYRVTGSDENIYPPMSTQLLKSGVKLYKGYNPENLSPRPDMVIIGNVISRGNKEAEAVLSLSIPYLSMPGAISEFFLAGRHSIVIAGTHGKTTASTLCAWLLEACGQGPSFLIGGVGRNFGTGARLSGDYFVIEGDEYDTAFFDKGPKFLHYQPKSVILGPVEFDHADIYRDLAHVMSSFEKLVKIMPEGGLLVACADSENTLKLLPKANCRVVTYGLSKKADYHPEKIDVSETGTGFILNRTPRAESRGFNVPMWGNHNLQNIVGVLALLLELGMDHDQLAGGLKTFEGIKRRQEIRGVVNGITVIDDFAHHPTAIKETVAAMRMRYPKAGLFSVFEPRSNTSKRNIFQREFTRAFEGSDFVIIAPPYRPEKIPENERLDVEKLVNEIKRKIKNSHYIEKTNDILDFISKKAKRGDVILIMSNGGFDDIHEKLLRKLK